MKLPTPKEVWNRIRNNFTAQEKVLFLVVFVVGLIIHMPALLMDVPNHDGLNNIYSSQNMVTSGRWFLSAACSLTGFYNLPWFIGLLAIGFISASAVVLSRLLELKNNIIRVLTGLLLVVFPSVASGFAYVYTLDGYMLGLLLALLAVYYTKKKKNGWIYGIVLLAFSLGIYQAYLPFAMILSLYLLSLEFIGDGSGASKARRFAEYLGMGAGGFALYYIILKLMLFVQNKELDTYQGISSLGGVSGGLLGRIKGSYTDFISFTVKGNVLINNALAVLAFVLLLIILEASLARMVKENKLIKKPLFYVFLLAVIILIPVCFNAVLLVSPGVNYHLLMRYQWVLCAILPLALADRYLGETVFVWAVLLAGSLLICDYAVTDNVGYANLKTKYEKTYGYAVRLLDRIEQTEGYYPGIPVAIIGVVSEDQYPITDLSADITWNLQGLTGDWLLYKPLNYEQFFKYYLGATLNFLPVEEVTDIYYSDEYVAMNSFPGSGSTKVVDGILYVKTENKDRSNE